MTTPGMLAVLAAAVAAGAAALGLHGTAGTPAPTAAEIRLQALASVARRLYREEARGTAAAVAAKRISRDPRVLAAIRARSPRALRAAALRELYLPGKHVVRLAVRGEGIGADVGGPFVVAPARRTFTVGGHVAHVQASIQDVAGYVKLIHRQTGLDAVVRDHHGHTYATFPQPRARLPLSGTAVVAGRPWLVRSFDERGWDGELLLVRVLSRV